jgi:hypothetical protein
LFLQGLVSCVPKKIQSLNMEQQRLQKTPQQQQDQETEVIQHGPLPVEQLQVFP